VVAAHGFTPNSNAKRLKQQGSQGVAIVVKGTRNLLFAAILELLQPEIRRLGYASFVTYIDEEDNEISRPGCCAGSASPWAFSFWAATWLTSGRGLPTSPCPACW
jgi:hypothetical protein